MSARKSGARAKAPTTHYEIVPLSKGKAIAGYPPVPVPMDALVKRRLGLLLTTPIAIVAFKDDKPIELEAVRLQGAGVKRTCTLATPVRIAPGGAAELGANSLLFPAE